MKYEWARVGIAFSLMIACLPAQAQVSNNQVTNNQVTTSEVKTRDGRLAGTLDAATGIRSFKGIPFAAPPVGNLRWQAPQPVTKWRGVRQATAFGPRAMQLPLFGDMRFRSNGMSEDCLYLNVWTPARSRRAKLPVLVYFFGGGFVGGDGSEWRYDGEHMAQQGIVAVTVNYRLGVFGFLAHPELTRESPHHASGNYGLLDQHAALEWVHQNIAAFGGDPRHVTIAGESAGSISVSAQMASPLSKGLMAGAIGESGAILNTLAPGLLASAEADGVKFVSGLDLGGTPSTGAAPSLAALRAIPAEQLLQASGKKGLPRLRATIDGYFFPKAPAEIYAAGEQMHVPLLAGVNSAESGYGAVLEKAQPTVENYHHALQRLYGDKADAVFQLYPATNETEVMQVAQELASDRFISYGTWKWVDATTRTGGQPTYYYLFSRPRPSLQAEVNKAPAPPVGSAAKDAPTATTPPTPPRGAVHSAEIEYALGNLSTNPVYAWTPDDYRISQLMQSYFANFIKTANPNGPGLPLWPPFKSGQRLIIDVNPHPASTDTLRARYNLLDSLSH
ncbi:MAG: carboxylesterase family protein [Abitibacteriaceae bacterium]|nr:carboxylesterase family protein [Abditibacteriaceae bacterium]